MSTYRTGNHWRVTIVREGERGEPCGHSGPDDPGHDLCAQLVAVVVNRDQALAERICALLNGDEAERALIEETRPTHRCPNCGAPVEVARVETTTHADLAAGRRTYVWGSWEACRWCGRTEAPEPIAPPIRDDQERADVRRRIAGRAEHRPSSLGDGLGYGPCVGCAQLWPCAPARRERAGASR